MNKFAHFFLAGFAVALMMLFAALALSNVMHAHSLERQLNSTTTSQSNR